MQIFDVWKIRENFPMLKKTMNGKPLIYLDSAATTQKPQVVIDMIKHFYEELYATVYRSTYDLATHATELYNRVREKTRHFINASTEKEVIFTRGTTESINLVARSFGRAFIRRGDEIVISEMEHHSNIVPWQLLCEEYGAKLRVIPIDDRGELRLDIFHQMLNEKTKLVSIAHVANVTGTINPIKLVIQKAHHYGAKVLIDGAQAASHMLVDVQDLDSDFYAFSGHKMYGPMGIGVLYGKKELLEMMPPFMGGGDMIDEVFMDHSTFQAAPFKFEAGTPSVAEVLGFGVAIDYIRSIGKEAISAWQEKLLQHATEKLLELKGVQLIGTATQKTSILSFTLEDLHPLDLGTILGLKGIAVRTGHLCAQPTLRRFGANTLTRLSFGLYNTHEEIDVCLHAIKEAMALLQPKLAH